MELQRTTYNQSLKLKELGFKISDGYGYDEKGMYGKRAGIDGEVIVFYPENKEPYGRHDTYNDIELIPAPQVVVALKWLRDDKNTFVEIQCQSAKKNQTFAFKMSSDGFADGYKSFEEAESAGLDFALDYLLKEKQQWN